MNNQWNQLLRCVRGDASAKLPKDEFHALIEWMNDELIGREEDLESLRARVAELEAQIAAIKRVQRWEFEEHGIELYRYKHGEYVRLDDIEAIIDEQPTSSGEG